MVFIPFTIDVVGFGRAVGGGIITLDVDQGGGVWRVDKRLRLFWRVVGLRCNRLGSDVRALTLTHLVIGRTHNAILPRNLGNYELTVAFID